MKKFIAFLSLIFIVTMFTYDAGASPPSYDQTGFYEVPDIDIVKVVIKDPQIIHVAFIDHYQLQKHVSYEICNTDISEGNIQNNQSYDNYYRDIEIHSNSKTFLFNYYLFSDMNLNDNSINISDNSYPLICYTSDTWNCSINKQYYSPHINYSGLKHYTLLGYSMKS